MKAGGHPDASVSTRFPPVSHSPECLISLPSFLVLKQTLDVLPFHLLEPFNGPVRPSNLLDKILRGVAEAKGPTD